MHILFAGGGTAGHINPALAVAQYISKKHPDAKISYIGKKGGMEERLVAAAGFDFYSIDVAGFQRKLTAKNIVRNISAAEKAITSSVRSKKLLKSLAPDVVVGTGGYVSGPVLRQAAKLGIKTAIHEQNAFPGVTTKMLVPLVDTVMLAMVEAKPRLKLKKTPIITGNPVREEFLSLSKQTARKELQLPDMPVLLSAGGSLGAAPINNAVLDLITAKWKDNDILFLHATGKGGYAQFVNELKNASNNIESDYSVSSFVEILLSVFLDNMNLVKVLFSNKNITNLLNEVLSIAYNKCKEKWISDLPNLDDEEIEYASLFIFNGALGIINFWVQNDFDKDIKEISQIIEQLSYYGTKRYIYKR